MQHKKTRGTNQLLMFFISLLAGYILSLLPTFGLIFLFGSFESAKEFTWLATALPAFAFAMFMASFLEKADQDYQEISTLTNEIKKNHDFISTYQFKFNQNSLEIDETQGLIFIKVQKDLSMINFNELLDVEISIDDICIASIKTNSGLGGAVVGGLLFGGAGAIAGAITSRKTTTDSNNFIEKVSLKLTIMSFSTPFKEITLLNHRTLKNSKEAESSLKVANEWYSILSNCIQISRSSSKDHELVN
nr:hypothetical protein [uncultured Halomonas sp.]